MNRIYLTPVVKQILIACIVLFLGSFLLLATKKMDLNNYLGLQYFFNPAFKPWQIITHMFMHDNTGITHILFNMFGLVTFGVILENVMGSKKFLVLYFLSGLGAILIHTLANIVTVYMITGEFWMTDDVYNGFIVSNSLQDSWQTFLQMRQTGQDVSSILESNSKIRDLWELMGIYSTSMVGASGCLYGVLASFVLLFPNTELYVMFIPVPGKAKFVIPGFIILDLVLGISKFSWDPVAHFAHIGGAVFGLLLTLYWRKFDRNSLY